MKSEYKNTHVKGNVQFLHFFREIFEFLISRKFRIFSRNRLMRNFLRNDLLFSLETLRAI